MTQTHHLRAEPIALDVDGDHGFAYGAERRRLMGHRLPITAVLYLALVGTATGVDLIFHPERLGVALSVYAGHATAATLGILLARLRPHRIETIAGVLGCTWSLLLTTYTVVLVGTNPERFASGQICLLYGLFFMMPWGWREQLAVSLTALAGLVAAGLPLGFTEEVVYGLVIVLTGAVTSTGGVYFLDRYRLDGFVRNALLTSTSLEKEEEADIAAALLHVSETLSRHLSEPDLLHRLTRVAVEALGCDWGSTFVWQEERQAYVLGGLCDAPPGARDEIPAVEFRPADLPLQHLAPGRLVEIEDAAAQALIPPPLLARWEVASEIIAPIDRDGRVVGALCLAYRERRGPFSERERRLVRGIAHSTTLALATLSLIDDLRVANQLRSEFVSTMSHELRTPLNVILGFAEMARDPAIDEVQRAGSLRRIEVAGRELLRLIEDTLAIGRLDAGRETVQREPIDLAELWASLGRECGAMRDDSHVALDWPAIPPGQRVHVDPRKLGMIVRNLVHNALKFTSHGRVHVGLRCDDPTLEIRVADTGIGIRPDDHAAIFEMFRQADGSDTRRYGGTGLGLYIVKRFVEQLGGTIRLESAPGRGATFTVTLPLRGTGLADVA
jgi:signal transduction histidine kinase